MYKVLIADDELPILEGLRTIIDWRALGFTVCAAVTDGETALSRIEELQPELVLMDLRMPGLDGMDVIEAARRHGYEGYFIILSGATEFSYAQRAIRSRASYYLTKSVDEDELADAVRAIAAELDAHARQRTQSTRQGKAELLFRLFTGIAGDAPEDLAAYGLSDDAYQVVACESYAAVSEAQPNRLQGLLTNLRTQTSPGDIILIENREFALLHGTAALKRFAAELQMCRTSSLPPSDWLNAFVCLGRVVHNPADIVLSYCDATKLMQRRFFCPPTRHVADVHDLPDVTAPTDIAAARYAKRLGDCIQAQNLPLLQSLLGDLQHDLIASGQSVSAAKLHLTEIYVTVRQQLAALCLGDKVLPEENAFLRQIEEAVSLSAAIEVLQGRFAVFAKQLRCSADPGEDVVTRMRQYIDRNCTRPLRLEELAPLFGYNPSYLGKLFREKTQYSFNEYLDKARMERAKALLSGSSKRVYEIAQELGYKDVDYFHKKFRKYVGCSPNEYRKAPNTVPKW